VRFFWAKGLNAKDTQKEMFPVCSGKCLSSKGIHNWVEKFFQGRSKVADARLGRPVEIATEVTVQWVEKLIRADRRITIYSVATAPECFRGLTYRKMHDRLKVREVCARWVPREPMDREKINRMELSLQHVLRYADEGKICLTGLLLGTNHWCITINANQSVLQCNGIIPVLLQPKSLRLRHQLGRLCLPYFGILREYC
jgi:hypothetical protein